MPSARNGVDDPRLSRFPVTASTLGQNCLTAAITRKASGGSPRCVRSPVRIAQSASRRRGAEAFHSAKRHVNGHRSRRAARGVCTSAPRCCNDGLPGATLAPDRSHVLGGRSARCYQFRDFGLTSTLGEEVVS
jgi:hypothetical protein